MVVIFNLHDVITFLSVDIHETQQLPLDFHLYTILSIFSDLISSVQGNM